MPTEGKLAADMPERPDMPATPAPQTPTAPLRAVFGRYRGRVERLDARGEAQVVIDERLAEPTDDEFSAVYGPTWQTGTASALFAQFAVVGALPGELVEIEVRWSLPRPGRRRAKRVPPPIVRLLRVIEAAPERVKPPCPVFGECGGCQVQQLRYDAQLDWKTGRVREALIAAGFSEPPVLPALGCESPWNYRNHMRFSVNREGQIGLTARGNHRLLPLQSCPIAHSRINDALAILNETPQPQPQALIRYGDATGQLILQPTPDHATRQRLQAAEFDVRESEFEEELHGARFRIRPSSFFQTNTAQANRMMDLTLAALPSGPDVTLVDAYCGVGTFARLLADRVGRVLAIEESASAIRDARWNLRNAPNVEILQAKVEERLPQITERLDGLVIDPPRAGCQRAVLDALIARRVPTVVYVSCDPDTLARDLAYLCLKSGVYRLVSVQPLDMFPQTAHIENVVTLDLTPARSYQAKEAEVGGAVSGSDASPLAGERLGEKSPLILASASPRRSQLLTQAGIPFERLIAPLDEDALTAAYTGPMERLGEYLARHKALAAWAKLQAEQRTEQGVRALASDTTVLLDGASLAKPRDHDEAVWMLRQLRGRTHIVATGVALIEEGDRNREWATHETTDNSPVVVSGGRPRTRWHSSGARQAALYSATSATRVTMRPYSDDEIAAYVATGDPLDKAGAYSIQHPAFQPVASLAGCHLGVIGLPLCLVGALLGGVAPRRVVPAAAGMPDGDCPWSALCRAPFPDIGDDAISTRLLVADTGDEP